MLRALPWALVLAMVACRAPLPTDPELAAVVTEDLPRFWQAFDQGLDGDLEGALDRAYFGPGTDHLLAFRDLRIGSSAKLAQTVRRNRGYYQSIRANTLAFSSPGAGFEGQLRAVFRRAKALEPAAVFAPVALLVGRMSTGGTTSPDGILIGLELYTRAPDSPTDTLDDFERTAITTSEVLVPLVAHEHVHILQAELGQGHGQTLLERCLVEGIADFVGEQTSGALATGEAYTYGPAHEAALWAEFQAAMDGTSIAGWLYNKGQDPARPGDLGYFIGYRIAQAYAKQQASPAAAVQGLLRFGDAKALLAASGYAGVAP